MKTKKNNPYYRYHVRMLLASLFAAFFGVIIMSAVLTTVAYVLMH